jgi:hypothetical protein
MLAGLLLISIYYKGYGDCETSNAKKETAALKKGILVHGEIKNQVQSLSDVDLDKRLAKWVR